MAFSKLNKISILGLLTGSAGFMTFDFANAQQPVNKQQPVVQTAGTSANTASAQRAVAHIFNNIPVTHEELADYLIARGGHEKIDLLINQKIIDIECAKRNITVTPQEIEAVLNDDLEGLGFNKDQFLEQFLPRYNKTYYEWMEDVIRPRLQLKKLCIHEVKVTEDDVKQLFENQYGEKRRCQMIMWPADQAKAAQQQFDIARQNQEGFDRIARAQGNASLAAASGHMMPISRHDVGKSKSIEKMAFELKVDETSALMEVVMDDLGKQRCFVMLKLKEIIPPVKDVDINDAKIKDKLVKTAQDRKVEAFIPEYFAKLKAAANPSKPYIGPPALWQTTAKKK